jgi:hypothetical protein
MDTKYAFSSLVVDSLQTDFLNDQACIAYLYCDYRERKQQTATHMIGALLKQIMAALPTSSVADEFLHDLQQMKRRQKPLELEDMRKLLVQSIGLGNPRKTFICIDGLDELKDQSTRRSMLQCLKAVIEEPSQIYVKLFITGRPNVEYDVMQYLTIGSFAPQIIRLEANRLDTMKFIYHEIEMDNNEVHMDDKFRKEIVDEIVAASDGM